MRKKWYRKKCTKIKTIVISPEEAAQRKAHTLWANAELAETQIPRLRADLDKCTLIIEAFAKSRGATIFDEAKLYEHILTRQAANAKRADDLRLAHARIIDAKREIKTIIKLDEQKQGLIRILLFGYIPSDSATWQIERQNEIIQQSESSIRIFTETRQAIFDDENAFLAAVSTARMIEQSIRQHELAKKKYQKLKEREERAKEVERKKGEKERSDKAIIASYLGKTRDLAEEIKKQLARQADECPYCPYCGRDYGDEPHADHIYPVSKGGLSTLENMVIICRECNLKKSNKSLREFIKLHQMNQIFIEKNLELLRKYF